MEDKNLNGVIFLDLRKAFDLVDPNILLAKLKLYKCDSAGLSWFESYLTGREQFVTFKGKTSNTLPVHLGAPQGSILGPLLFFLFINDLPLYTSSSVDMYADDSTLSNSAKTITDLEDKLSSDLSLVSNWCNNNRMVLNADKTKAMVISTYQKLSKLPRNNLQVTYDGDDIKNVDKEKLLGVIIDKHLTWKPQ